MSSGLTFNNWAKVSSLALLMSNVLMSTFHVLPFTTIRRFWLVSVLMEDVPRKRIVVPLPKLPELEMMSSPAIRPCKASSTVVMPNPSNSFVDMVWVAKLTSLSGIASPPLFKRFLDTTDTSFITRCADSNVMLYTVRFMGSVCVLYPIKLTFSLFFVLFTFMAKWPLKSVIVALMLRPVASTSHTVAPINVSISSRTVPLTDVIWA